MENDGHKNNLQDNNFVDILLLNLCSKLAPPIHQLGITPNMATMFGLILGIIAIYFLIQKKYILSIGFLWLTYLSDCLDGYLARKYNQATQLGDYLDHFRDQFVCLTVIILTALHIQDNFIRLLFIITITIYGIFMLVQLGCQERLSPFYHANECLGRLKPLCPGEDARVAVRYTKWFGCGTFYLVLSVFIVLIRFQH